MSEQIELSDDDVFGAAPAQAELSDADVFNAPAPAPATGWDAKSWPERAGHQFHFGLESGRQSLEMGRAAGAATGLANVRQNEANWAAEEQRDPEMANALRGRFRGPGAAQQERLVGVVRQGASETIASQQRQAAIPSSPHPATMRDQMNRGEFGAAWDTFTSHFGDIAGQAIFGGLPTMAVAAAPAIASSVMGLGALPTLFATFGGSAAARLSGNSVATIAENAKADGIDLTNADALASWMTQRPERLQDALHRAGQGAVAGALVDTLAMGMTRAIRPGAGLAPNAGALGRNFAVGMAQPPGSEAASQIGMHGAVTDLGAVAQAATIGPVMVAGNTAVRTVGNSMADSWQASAGGTRIGMDPMRGTNRPPGPPGPEMPSGPMAPRPAGGSFLDEVIANTPTSAQNGTAQPLPGTTPPGAAPRPPAGGQGGGGAGGAPVEPIPGQRPIQGETEYVEQVLPSGRVIMVERLVETKPAPTPATAAAPNEPAPTTALSPSLSPSTPIPPIARPTPMEAALDATTNDPRTGTEIAAQAAQERGTAIATAQQQLQPGLTIEKTPGGWSLMEGGTPLWTTPGEWPTDQDLADFVQSAADLPPSAPGTSKAPTVVTSPDHIAVEAAQVQENPTEAQAKAGTYRKGHIDLDGVQIAMENPAGSVRSGTSPDGTEWANEQPAHYGYIQGTKGADGDPLDVYLGPQAHEPRSGPVFIIDQRDPHTGAFDEHKIMVGFGDEGVARLAYQTAFGDGSDAGRIGAVTSMGWDQFKRWIKSRKTTKPLAYEAPPPAPKLTVRRRLRTFKKGPLSLGEYLAITGGIRDDRGDLQHIGAHQHFIPRAGMLVRKTGRTLDYARVAAAEQGYLPMQSDIRDFLDLIDQEVRGFPVYAGADVAEVEADRQAEAVERERAALDEIMPRVMDEANRLGLVLTPHEKDQAAYHVLQHGLTPLAALWQTVHAGAEEAHRAAILDAAADFDVTDATLRQWADDLGAELTPQQFNTAREIMGQGWHPAQAVHYAAGIAPALDALQHAEDTIPFEETSNVGQPDQPGDIGTDGRRPEPERQPQPGSAGSVGGRGPTDGGPASAGKPTVGPSAGGTTGSAPAVEQPVQAQSEPTGEGAGPAAAPGNAATESKPRPSAEGAGPQSEPSRPGWDGGEQFVIPGAEQRPTGVEKPRPGRQPQSAPTGGLFEGPEAGNQTDLVDAVKASRDVGNLADPNPIGLARAFEDEFAAGKVFKTIQQARKLASDWLGAPVQPGTRQAKAVDEAIELGAVMFARRVAGETQTTPLNVFDRLLHLYNEQMPRLGVRTGDSVTRQAYSTPLPLAYAVSRLTGAATSKGVYEPTAGNGALMIEVPTERGIVNEMDPARRQALQAQGFSPTDQDATTFQPDQPYSVVLANPPFGAGLDHNISLKALAALPKDGRAALIIAGPSTLQLKSPEQRRVFYRGRLARAFFAKLQAEFNVTDHLTVPGAIYAGQGAAWPVDVIIIEGRGKSSRPLPAAQLPRMLTGWDDIRRMIDATGQSQHTDDNSGDALAPGGGNAPGVGPDDGGASGGAGGAPAGRPGPDKTPSAGNLRGDDDAPGGVDVGETPGPGIRGPGTGTADGGSGPQPEHLPVPEPDAGGRGVDREEPGRADASPAPVPDGDTAKKQPASRRPGAGNQPGGVAGPVSAGSVEPGLTVEESLTAPPPDTKDQRPEAAKPSGEALKKDVPTDTQVAYKPVSKAEPVGTLAPLNLATAMQGALARLEAQADGNLDAWVGKKLGFTEKQVQGRFSAEQVDGLALAIAQIDAGKGFVVSDATGVGKGRLVAGLIRYATKQGKIPFFVTERPTLYKDMARDLIDIGMDDAISQILPTNNGLKLPLTDDADGPKLNTPGTAAHEAVLAAAADAGALPEGKKIVFTTYSQMQQTGGANTTRMRFASALAPNAFIILDESHNAGGQGGKSGDRAPPINKKTGMPKVTRSSYFRDLIDRSHAVAYSSATWAKRPNVMDLYARKTDMRLAVENLDNLADTIARGGVPMQQIVSAQLAQVGQFTRRERSFAGIDYRMELAPVDRGTYDETAGLMAGIFDLYERFVKPQIKNLQDAQDDIGGKIGVDGGVGAGGISSVGFGSTMHNVISQMLLASKAKETADRVLAAIKDGKKPVVAVANTMETLLSEVTDGVPIGGSFDLSFNDILSRYLKRQLRYSVNDADGNPEHHYLTPEDLGHAGAQFYHALNRRIRAADLSDFPASPIDYIINRVQAAGHNMREITGRQSRVAYETVQGENGKPGSRVTYENRPGSESTPAGKNAVMRDFNNGGVDALLINQSAASGVSLHSYYKFKDQRPRLMIIAQAEANIDTHMQILGRVHRTGQVVLPEYVQLVADVPAEKRPAAVLAKKMASLSASTTANRRGMLGSNSVVDFMNRYGGIVARGVLAENPELIRRLGLNFGAAGGSEEDGKETSIEDAMESLSDIDPDTILRRFTGRIPLLPLTEQEELYKQIEGRYTAMIEELDASGENTLEAKTIDLRARTIDSVEIMAGQPGGNPFSAPVSLEKVDVRRTSKPPPAWTIVRAVDQALGGQKQALEASLREEKIEGLARHAETAAIVEGERWLSEQMRTVDASLAGALSSIEKRFVDPAAVAKARKQAEDNAARVRALLRVARPGVFVQVGRPGASDDDLTVTMPMAVMGASSSKSAHAPSAWEFTLIQSDGVMRRISGSSLVVQDGKASVKEEQRLLAGVPAQTWQDFLTNMAEHSSEGREERYMVTGNLLAGFAKVRGQILNYTDADGAIRQGILMPRDFNSIQFTASQAQAFPDRTAADFLRATGLAAPAFVESTDGIVRIVGTDQPDTFFIDVPLAKADGGKYYTDPFLRRALTDGDFVSRGNKMRGKFTAANLNRVLGGVLTLLKRSEGSLISTHPEAKSWAAKQGEGFADRLRAVAQDQRGAVDINAIIPERMQHLVQHAAETLSRKIPRFLNRAFDVAPDGVTFKEDNPAGRRITPLSGIRTPTAAARGTGFERMIHDGIIAEEKQGNFIKRLLDDYHRLLHDLKKAGGSFDKVSEALFAGDVEGVDARPGSNELDEHFDEFSLAPSERRAYLRMHRLLQKVARVIDQHNRAMMPRLREQQHRVWRSMERLLTHATVRTPEARALYAERRRHVRAVQNGGEGALAAGARVAEINARLRAIRTDDPQVMEELSKAQTEYDDLEARLSATMMRNRIKGYIPHIFFGSWRLWRFTPNDDPTIEEPGTWEEVTSDQGFYPSRSDALAVAQKITDAEPGTVLEIRKRMTKWPDAIDATEASDRSVRRFISHVEDRFSDLSSVEIQGLVKGVIKRRFRRRKNASSMLRKGYDGYSQDMDRVIRTHIGRSIRYVVMDKLKHDFITRHEAAGFHRSTAAMTLEDRMTKRWLEAWWRDVNGGKQAHEEFLDNFLLRKGGLPTGLAVQSVLVTAAGAALGFGYSGTLALTGYFGWKLYSAMRGSPLRHLNKNWGKEPQAGDFPTRTYISNLLSDQAHLKLGAMLNLKSAVVNMTQTALTTFPVLGRKYTTVGLHRAIAGLIDQTMGRETADARLLVRAGVRTSFHITDSHQRLAMEDGKVARMSMFAFQGVETLNRAIAFMGAYQKTLDEGGTEGAAMREGQAVVRRTQFHQGNADKSTVLRWQVLRAPLQFKNFMVHMLEFTLSLGRKEHARFWPMMWLFGGVRAFPGLLLTAAVIKLVTLGSLNIDAAMKDWMISMNRQSDIAGLSAAAVLYGPVSVVTGNLSASVAVGPTSAEPQLDDFLGPLLSTIHQQALAEKENASLIDRLVILSPAARPLKALETAANGTSMLSRSFWKSETWQQHTLTNWRQNGATVYHPNLRQILMLGAGFTPIEQTIMSDFHSRMFQKKEEAKGKADAVLSDWVRLYRESRHEEANALIAQAVKPEAQGGLGLNISPEMLIDRARGVVLTQPQRDFRSSPLRLREGAEQDAQGIGRLLGGPNNPNR